jgi:hypothetical protein
MFFPLFIVDTGLQPKIHLFGKYNNFAFIDLKKSVTRKRRSGNINLYFSVKNDIFPCSLLPLFIPLKFKNSPVLQLAIIQLSDTQLGSIFV